MAIIRKGDKEAEAGLKARAKEQRENRRNASDNAKQTAGLTSARAVKIDPKTKSAYTLDLGNPITGDAFALNKTQFSGPISGSAVARGKRLKTKAVSSGGSGIIQGGKVIKGGDMAKGLAKKQQRRKKAMDK
jgi:hypothetical protein